MEGRWHPMEPGNRAQSKAARERQVESKRQQGSRKEVPREGEFWERRPWERRFHQAGEQQSSSLVTHAARERSARWPEDGGARRSRGKRARHLRPGVKGKVDTPDKQKRKGSFLRRHFTHPHGPMVKDGEPSRLALSAHTWRERVPRTTADAAKLAGRKRLLLLHVLEQYRRSRSRTRTAGRRDEGRRRARHTASCNRQSGLSSSFTSVMPWAARKFFQASSG
jgi:hypothetical protein